MLFPQQGRCRQAHAPPSQAGPGWVPTGGPQGQRVAGCPPDCVLRLLARGRTLPLHDCGFWSHHGLSSWPNYCYCGPEGHLVTCLWVWSVLPRPRQGERFHMFQTARPWPLCSATSPTVPLEPPVTQPAAVGGPGRVCVHTRLI